MRYFRLRAVSSPGCKSNFKSSQSRVVFTASDADSSLPLESARERCSVLVCAGLRAVGVPLWSETRPSVRTPCVPAIGLAW